MERAAEGEFVMVKGIAKMVGGIVAVGIAVFAAIAAAGLAGWAKTLCC